MRLDQDVMKHLFLTTTLVICLLAFAATSSFAQDELHKSYPLAPNGTVSLTNLSGTIRITGWNENRVQVDAVKRGNQEEFSQVEIRVTESPDRLEITTIYPRNNWRGRNQVEVVYDLKVPRGAVLTPIASTSGDITITEAGSRVVARSTSGNVTVRGIRGATTINSTSGDVSAEQMGGTLNISSTSGNVHLKDVEAKVISHTTSGDLTAINVRDDLSATATSGEIQIEKVAGRLSAQTMSGKLSVKDISGDATLQGISDAVTADNIRGRLTVNSVSADVIIRNVQEGARVNSVSGTITITQTKGLIEAKTTSGDINVREVESREVQLNTHSGQINYAGSFFDDGRYGFESFNGNIILLIPSNSNFALNVNTFNGQIETDFPITLPPGMTQTNRPRRLQGTYGKGNGAEIKIGGFNASIKLKKQ